MEVSVIGISQVKTCRTKLAYRELRFCLGSGVCSFETRNGVSFGARSTRWNEIGLRCSKVSVRCEAAVSDKVPVLKSMSGSRSLENVRLFVGLPMDTVADCKTVNHAKAIAAGLRALKLLGVEGVELPIWWGVVENETMGKYEWSGYLALAEMAQKAELKLHVSLCFHASKQPNIPLPEWVTQIGEAEPSIYFTDRSGKQFKDCLSLAVDDLPVLDGKTPLEVYRGFCESFKSSFSTFMGSTITGITMSLGPDGELRYPSHHQATNNVPGVGEFQCYDENILSMLKQHAEVTGNPLWGLGGPHDAPSYEQPPNSTAFFEDGGSWESPYGDFFLSWYSSLLVSHGDRVLSLASSTFGDSGVTIYGKLPLLHPWYKIRSRPSELTAGFYSTSTRDGYEAVAEMFSKNSCKMILPGMDLSDEHQSSESLSSPESLFAQIKTSCKKHGVEVSGQNSSTSGLVPGGFDRIKKNLSDKNIVIDLFTYQRMGAYFFSPEHFPAFTEFVRSLNQLELHADDLPTDGEEESTGTLNVSSATGTARMQAA